MRKVALLVVFLSLPALLAAQCSSVCQPGVYSGVNGPAQYVVCMPQPTSCYKGDMILFAHGYVPQGSPADAWLGQLALPDGTTLPSLVNGLGFGFAASSFSKDGLAILQGIQETKALTGVVQTLGIPVHKYFITGASEGGLIAAKSVENDPAYGGGLAVCGEIGSFRKQINYLGDVRVLFDYFFPGILPGSAVNIPATLIANWYTVYEPAVRKAVNANFFATLQLISTGQIPIGLNFANADDSITAVLWYNVFATNDAIATLGGQPYDNIGRVYRGSFNDAKLNLHVARFAADPAAVINMAGYETTGQLADQLVTLHTIADPVVPFWQETLYTAKAHAAGSSSKLAQLPVFRYGHCNVTGKDAEAALLLLLLKAGL